MKHSPRRSFHRTMVRLVVVAVPMAVTPITLAASAHAVPTVCEPNTVSIDWPTRSAVRTVTHAKYISIPSGGSGSVTRSVTKVAQITASVSFTTSATVSASVVLGDLSATVGTSLAASGSITRTSSESVTVNVGPGRYAFFSGKKKYNGDFTGWKCNRTGTKSTALRGRATSFAVTAEGAARCNKSYPSSSFEYKAKKKAC